MSKHTVTITGVTTGISPQSGPPPRLAIQDLINDQKMFSLYIQALTVMLTQGSQNDAISHFQIGGIHGKPYVEWDGSGGPTPVPDSWNGYCTHGSVLFPTWHRPYVALYEQAVQGHVMAIADSYTTSDKADWQDAGRRFRVPYWDWAQTSVPPSQVISDATVNILVAPSAHPHPVANPLLGYRFHPLAQGTFDFPWSEWPETLRCPTSQDPDATSDANQLIQNLTGPSGQVSFQLTQATYFLLTQVDSWLDMSNHTPNINPNAANSLEKIHDNIHVFVGGDNEGHMGDPTTAAFDPIFFLHHANVDRLLALWQAIHYQSFVPDSVAADGNWTIEADSEVNAASDLTPFWNTPNTYWNSNEARNFKNLGYTYPEFVGQQAADPPTLASHIKDVVNQLYGGGTGENLTASDAGAAGVSQALFAAQSVASSVASAAGAAAGTAQKVLSSGRSEAPSNTNTESTRDWSVRIQSRKFQLGGSYSVFVFLGPVPENPNEWRMSPSLVGTDEIFANSSAGHCVNCQKNAEIIVEGYVHLNQALARSPVKSLDPDVVVPYLKENLSWRVFQHRQIVPISRLSSLKVTVVSTPLELNTGDKFPRRAGDIEHHHEITRGQPGGHLA